MESSTYTCICKSMLCRLKWLRWRLSQMWAISYGSSTIAFGIVAFQKITCRSIIWLHRGICNSCLVPSNISKWNSVLCQSFPCIPMTLLNGRLPTEMPEIGLFWVYFTLFYPLQPMQQEHVVRQFPIEFHLSLYAI